MSSLIILLLLLFYLILAIKRLDWAVMLMLALLPSYQIRFNLFGLPMTVLELMILLAFTVWLVKNYKEIIENVKNRFKLQITNYKLQIFRYPFDIEIAAVLIISWLAIVVAGFSDSAMGVWKAYFFEPALVFILILNVFGKGERMRHGAFLQKVLLALAISAFWISGVAIFQKLTGLLVVPEFWPRVTGPWPYPNALGLYLGPIVLIMVGYFFSVILEGGAQHRLIESRDKAKSHDNTGSYRSLWSLQDDRFLKIFIGLTIVMSLIAIILARSEGALAGIMVALVVTGMFLLASKRPKIKWLPVTVLFFVVLFVFLSSMFFLKIVPEHKYYNFNSTCLNYATNKLMLKDISGEIRKQQWRETIAMLKENKRWVLGTGLSNYQVVIAPYHQEGIFFNFERDPDFRNKLVWSDDDYKATHWQPTEIYMYPHNLVLNFWTEIGLLGAIIFIWLISKFLYITIGLITKERYKIPSNSAGRQDTRYKFFVLGLMGAMIVIVVHGIVDVPYFKNDLAIIFWLILALQGIIKIQNQVQPLRGKDS